MQHVENRITAGQMNQQVTALRQECVYHDSIKDSTACHFIFIINDFRLCHQRSNKFLMHLLENITLRYRITK